MTCEVQLHQGLRQRSSQGMEKTIGENKTCPQFYACTCQILVIGNKQSNQWENCSWFTQMGTKGNEK